MEGLAVLLGLVVLFCTVVLPVLTYFAVRGLNARVEALEESVLRELRGLRKALGPAAAREAPLPEAAASSVPAAAAAKAPLRVPEAAASSVPAAAVAKAPLRVPAADVVAVRPPSSEAAAPSAPPPLPAEPARERAGLAEPAVAVSEADSAGARLLRRMWNWIVVGEEFRKPGLSAEFAVATTWLVRSGVLIAVFAVGFGLQLSIARGLLGPAGRVALALACGSGFLLAGLRCMGRRYRALGQGFVGGGLAMFYFAFYAASVMFRLMAVPWAFVCMAAVTASAVVLAVRLEALSVAVLGALGGYLTPLVLSGARPEPVVLDAYLTVLALGMAGVAVWRQWPLLTWLSLVLNSLLFVGFSGAWYGWQEGRGTGLEVAHLCVFFAVYSTAAFVHGLRKRIPATFVEIGILFLNAAVTLGGGAWLVGCGPGQRVWVSVLALGLAAFYVGHVWLLIARGSFDRGLLSAFIALAVIFMGIALPLLFTGQVLSAAFALQALGLLWVGQRLDSRMFSAGALFFYAVVALRLAGGLVEGDFSGAQAGGTYLDGLKDRVAEYVIPIAALFLGGRLFRRPVSAGAKRVGDGALFGTEIGRNLLVVFVAVFYVGLIAYATRECYGLAAAYLPCARRAAVTLVWALFAAHLLAARDRLPALVFQRLLAMAALLLVAQWLLFGWVGAEWPVVGQLRHAAPFSAATALPRLAATGACLAVLLGARRSLSEAPLDAGPVRRVLLSVALAAGFLYLTFETATCCTAYLKGFRAGAVSVVWGCYGLSLLVGGLRAGQRGLRMAGLALFFVTVGKVFLIDLAGLDVLYRLIAFAVLGVVLLLAAFAYLKNQDVFRKPGVSDLEVQE